MTVVKLSVHKNNSLQRKKKQFRKQGVLDIKSCIREKDIVGYCMVAWDDNKGAQVAYEIMDDRIIDLDDMPKFMKSTLEAVVLKNKIR